MKEFKITKEHLALVDLASRRLPELDSMPKSTFILWLAEHEELYYQFRGFAMAAHEAGVHKASVYMIRERVRWHVAVEKRAGDEFKISNNVTPYLARTLMIDCPELEGMFSIKGPR